MPTAAQENLVDTVAGGEHVGHVANELLAERGIMKTLRKQLRIALNEIEHTIRSSYRNLVGNRDTNCADPASASGKPSSNYGASFPARCAPDNRPKLRKMAR